MDNDRKYIKDEEIDEASNIIKKFFSLFNEVSIFTQKMKGKFK